MQYIQPTSGAEQNFGFGDLSNAELHMVGTLGAGGLSSPVSSPLGLIPAIRNVDAPAPFPWWLVVVAIGAAIVLSNGGNS